MARADRVADQAAVMAESGVGSTESTVMGSWADSVPISLEELDSVAVSDMARLAGSIFAERAHSTAAPVASTAQMQEAASPSSHPLHTRLRVEQFNNLLTAPLTPSTSRQP